MKTYFIAAFGLTLAGLVSCATNSQPPVDGLSARAELDQSVEVTGGALLAKAMAGQDEIQWRQLGENGLELVVIERSTEGDSLTRAAFLSSSKTYAATSQELAAKLVPGFAAVIEGSDKASYGTGIQMTRLPDAVGSGLLISFPNNLDSPAVVLNENQAQAFLDALRVVAAA